MHEDAAAKCACFDASLESALAATERVEKDVSSMSKACTGVNACVLTHSALYMERLEGTFPNEDAASLCQQNSRECKLGLEKLALAFQCMGIGQQDCAD